MLLAAVTVLLAVGTGGVAALCGAGLVGDGVCSTAGDCCSEFGQCGRNASHCGFGCKGGPCWTPLQLVRFYVDGVPAEALGLGGADGGSNM